MKIDPNIIPVDLEQSKLTQPPQGPAAFINLLEYDSVGEIQYNKDNRKEDGNVCQSKKLRR